MRKVDANWYEGRIGDRKGIVPSSYLDVFSEPEVKGMFVLEEAAHYVNFFFVLRSWGRLLYIFV